jgi:hypothetical protein
MRRTQKVNRIKQAVGWGGTLLLFFLISACGSIGGSGQCGGAEDSGSCVRVESIIPAYLGGNTSNVDAAMNVCSVDPSTGVATVEVFTDHSAAIQVSNSSLPGAPANTTRIITLRDYSVEYSINRCPAGSVCPALTLLTVAPGQTTVIPANGSTTFSLPFVPLATKDEYVRLGGSLATYPSYTALYTITGTDSFNKSVSIQGAAEFTIGDFSNCP